MLQDISDLQNRANELETRVDALEQIECVFDKTAKPFFQTIKNFRNFKYLIT